MGSIRIMPQSWAVIKTEIVIAIDDLVEDAPASCKYSLTESRKVLEEMSDRQIERTLYLLQQPRRGGRDLSRVLKTLEFMRDAGVSSSIEDLDPAIRLDHITKVIAEVLADCIRESI